VQRQSQKVICIACRQPVSQTICPCLISREAQRVMERTVELHDQAARLQKQLLLDGFDA